MRPFLPLFFLVLVLMPAGRIQAADASPPPPEISAKVAAKLGELKPLLDAKNYDGILALIDPFLAVAETPDYDRAVLSQLKAQVLLTQGRSVPAIAPLETALTLSDRHGYFDKTITLELVYLLCQIHYQQGAEATALPAQQAAVGKAADYLDRWLRESPERSPDGQAFAASLLYTQGTLDPDKPDLEKIAAAQAEAEEGLRLSTRPKEPLYLVILAAAQHQEKLGKMGDLLELLVEKHPDNATYWQQLLAVYLAQSAGEADPKEARRVQVRAALTLERAQARGLMDTPKDRFNRVGIYFNLQRFDRASALLETGLAEGRIESTRGNWELLASAYQQTGRQEKAVATLTHAAGLFPKEGQIEHALAQVYYAQEQREPAYRHLQLAATKGNLEKPGQTYLLLGYLAYELTRYDEAVAWVSQARETGQIRPDEVAKLFKAIDEAVKSRASSASNPS